MTAADEQLLIVGPSWVGDTVIAQTSASAQMASLSPESVWAALQPALVDSAARAWQRGVH